MYLKSYKSKWFRLSITLLISFVCVIGLSQLKFSAVKASNLAKTEVYPTEIASTMWQNGFFPVENFQSYTSPFGWRTHPITGEVQFHNGLDLAAPLGSYVRSWWSGKVVKVAQDNTCGTHVVIESGTWQHVYCHLNGRVTTVGKNRLMMDKEGGIQILQGQEIPAGTRIGRIGMTGRVSGPHLHWVLRNNGDYVDPALIIREMFRQEAHLMPKSNYDV